MFIVNECTFTGYNPLSLDLAYLIAILLGTLVIITKNPVISVLFLIGLFLTISCYLILIGLNFIGLSYLLVYIGAVSILFLFIVMLINVRISELSMDTINSIPLGLFIGVSFNYLVNNVLPYMMLAFNNLLYHFNIVTRLANVTSVS
jgi:NADH-ubiquinone oxidoreductase chain 6